MLSRGEVLRLRVIGERVGSIEVLDAAVSLDDDVSGKLSVFLALTLTDPRPDDETWPIDDLMALDRRVHLMALEALPEQYCHVRFRVLNDEALDDDDPDEEDD